MCFTSRVKDIKMTSLPEAVCWHSTLRKGWIWSLVMDECLYDLSVIELCESRNKTEKTISNLHFLCKAIDVVPLSLLSTFLHFPSELCCECPVLL